MEPNPKPSESIRRTSFGRGRGRGRRIIPTPGLTCSMEDQLPKTSETPLAEMADLSSSHYSMNEVADVTTEIYKNYHPRPIPIPWIKPDIRAPDPLRPESDSDGDGEHLDFQGTGAELTTLMGPPGRFKPPPPPPPPPRTRTRRPPSPQLELQPSRSSNRIVVKISKDSVGFENNDNASEELSRGLAKGFMEPDLIGDSNGDADLRSNEGGVRNSLENAEDSTCLNDIDEVLVAEGDDGEQYLVPPRSFLTQMDEGKYSVGQIPMKCDHTMDDTIDRELEKSERQAEYHMKYLEVRQKLERKIWIKDYITGRGVLTIDTVNDSYLTSELFSMYGRMDQNAKQFKLMLSTYKELVYSNIEKWTKEAEEILENANWTLGPPPIPDSEPDESAYVFMTDFSTTEFDGIESIKLLDDLNPIRKAKVDFLCLPRESKVAKPGTSGCMANRSDLVKKEKSKSSILSSIPKCMENDGLESTGSNLTPAEHLLELERKSKFSEVLRRGILTPSHGFPPDEFIRLSSWTCSDKIGLKLRYNLEKNMEPNRFGISEDNYVESFVKNEGYFPCMEQLEFYSVRSMFISLPQIFHHWPMNPDGIPRSFKTGYNPDTIIIPAYMRGCVPDQVTFLWSIWHLYLILLGRVLNSTIPLQDLDQRCYMNFGFRFDWSKWGFRSVQEFCEYLNWRFPRPGVLVVKATTCSGDEFMCLSRYSEDYDKKLKNRNENQEKIEEPLDQEKGRAVARPTIPRQFAGPEHSILCFSEEDLKEKTLRCTMSHAYSPHYFFLSLNSYQHLKISLQTRAKQFIQTLGEPNVRNAASVNLELVKPFGHFLIGLFEGHWYRVMTICREKTENEFLKVVLVDHGIFTNIHVKDLRYMPLMFLNLQALAIACRLRVPETLREYFYPPRFDPAWLANFDRFCFGADLAVDFLHLLDLDRNPIWTVNMRRMKEMRGDIASIFDLPYRTARTRRRIIPKKSRDYTIRTDDTLQNDAIPKSHGTPFALDLLMILPAFDKNGEFMMRMVEEDPVVPDPSEEPVVPDPSEEQVVPDSSEESVVPDPSEEPVVPDPSEEPVVPDPSEEPVVPDPSEEPVVPDPSEEPVVPDLHKKQ